MLRYPQNLQYTLTMRAFKQHHSTVYKFTERKRLHGRYWHNFVQCRLSINGIHDFSIVLLTGSCFNYCKEVQTIWKINSTIWYRLSLPKFNTYIEKMYKISNHYNKWINWINALTIFPNHQMPDNICEKRLLPRYNSSVLPHQVMREIITDVCRTVVPWQH